MTEQKTIQEVTALAQSWGPVGTAVFVIVLFVLYQMYSNFVVKKKAFDPIRNLEKDKASCEAAIAELKIEINNRPTFEKLSEKMDKYQLAEVAKAHHDGLDKRLANIEALLQGINEKIK